MLRLGVIGISPGNGHPYSWSAIFNGYDAAAMEGCGFPVIPRYLEQRRWPDHQIAGARVTHVWTQDRAASEQIARAARIEHVVDTPQAMLGHIDAVLLARDDAENHLALAAPFLHAGLPIYIDKPVALRRSRLAEIYALERFPGQIFSCSALKYSPEFHLSEADKLALGGIAEIVAFCPKSWATYAPHIVEPALFLARPEGLPVETLASRHAGGTTVIARWADGFRASFFTLGELDAPIALHVFGRQGHRQLAFSDSFSAFRAALQDFIDGVRLRDVRVERGFLEQAVTVIEAGIDAD